MSKTQTTTSTKKTHASGIHWNKLAAIMKLKTRALFSKNFIIMPIFAVGLTFVLKFLYGFIANGNEEILTFMYSMALGLGATMNVSMTGMVCTSMALAEEKEKHTLRALMTSSVNGLEFFLGSIIPVLVMIVAVNAILVLITAVSMSPAGWALWLGISLLCSVASAVLGMILGICAKNQVNSSTLSTIPLLVLAMIPSFSSFHPAIKKISDLLFTGILMNTSASLVEGTPAIDALGLCVIAVEIALAVIAFLLIYRRNGYDAD